MWSGWDISLTAIIGIFAFRQQLDVPTSEGIDLSSAGVVVLNLLAHKKAHSGHVPVRPSHFFCAQSWYNPLALCLVLRIDMHNALFLLAAIACEVTATTALNYTHQFTRLLPSVITVVGYVASFYLLSMALRTVPIGIAYALWSGIGIVLITLIGVFVFKQQPDLPALIGIGLIMAGVMVINLWSHMAVH